MKTLGPGLDPTIHVDIPLNSWTIQGARITSATNPKEEEVSNVQTVVWDATHKERIEAEVRIPSDYDSSAGVVYLKLAVLETGSTDATLSLDINAYKVRAGAAVSSDLYTGAGKLVTAGGTNPEELSFTITGTALLPGDKLQIQLTPKTGHLTDDVWLYGSHLEVQARRRV